MTSPAAGDPDRRDRVTGMPTTITVIFDNPIDPASFEEQYHAGHVALASALPGVERVEASKVWPKEDGSPTPCYRLLSLYFPDYETASAAVTTPEAGAWFGDVQTLATLFMRKLSQQLGMPQVAITDSVRASLARYDWPGNVRELRNVIERTLILGAFPDDFAGPAVASAAGTGSLAEMEWRHIRAVLKETGGNRDEAARRLGISRKTIDRKFALANA